MQHGDENRERTHRADGERGDGPVGCALDWGGGHVPPRYCRTMALRLDPQVYAELAALVEALGETEESPVGDVEARRRGGHRMLD